MALLGALVLAAACDRQPAAGVAGQPSGPAADVERLPDGPTTQIAQGITPPDGPVGPLDSSAWVAQPPFHAAGDEPYWRLDTADGWFVFQRSGLPDIEAPMKAPQSTGGKDTFDTPPLQVVISREACETASQTSHMSARVVFDSIDYTGCVFDGTSGGAGEAMNGVTSGADATLIADSIGAIDACLARLGETAVVTAIYPRGSDRKAMGLRMRSGALYECAVEQTGELAFLDQVEPDNAGAWMMSMKFLREGQLSAAQCPNAEEIRANGVLLGRMLPAACKF
jgi:uncharacterized membrane protein